MRQRATVLERLDGTLILRTDQHRRVNLSTDGQRLWVEVERAAPKPAPRRFPDALSGCYTRLAASVPPADKRFHGRHPPAT